MSDMLNIPQRSSVAIALRAFEKALRRADAALQGPAEEQGILYRRTMRLPMEKRPAIRQQIALALTEIAEVAQQLGLAVQEDPLESDIAAELSLDWAGLCDVRSAKLKRYGAVDVRLAEALDPHIERLADLALAIASQFKRSTAG